MNAPAMNELPLRDIHLPDAVSWWPPAIGWWLLAIIIVALAYGIYKIIKIQKHKQKNIGSPLTRKTDKTEN